MGRRGPALVLIAALVIVAGLVNRGHDERQVERRDQEQIRLDQPAAAPMAVAAPADALSSTWYCAAGTATRGGMADMVVAVANPGSRDLVTEVTAVTDKGASRTRRVSAPAHSRVRVLLRDIVTARYAAALVEVRGGAVSVDREAAGGQGYDARPCASRAADHWYFAAGSTLRGADEYLALFNPYPDDTTVDITFATEQGPRSPRRLQALPVPGRSLRVVHLNAERVNRHSLVAARVVARSGRLVVDRLQVFDGSGDPVRSSAAGPRTDPPQGLTVSSGVTRPAVSWAFPAGRKTPGAREQIVVFNPSDREASVDIGITLDDPSRNGRLDPIPLSIPPGDVKVLDVTDQATVPDNVDHSISVRSTNRVAVVADQLLTGGAPWNHLDASIGPGSPLEARTWLFASGGVTPDTSEQLVVQNLSGQPVTVEVTVLGGTRPLNDQKLRNIAVPGDGRVTVSLDRLKRPSLPVELRASGPVVAMRAVYRTGRRGLSIALGVPLPEGARVPPPR